MPVMKEEAPPDPREIARVFKALSVESRVRILLLLKGRSMCVNALASKLEMTPPAVSQHLRILRDTGIVLDRKCGNFVHYRLNPETMASWKTLASNLLEGEAPGCPGSGAHPPDRCR